MKKPKLLIETSSVRAVLGDSTKDHVRHVKEQIAGGRLYSSAYIRMEFIRRWFCDAVRIALTIDQFHDVGDALIFLEQDFSPRNMKGYLAVLAKYLSDAGAMNSPRAAAEEMASLAVAWLNSFDIVFESRIPNTCHCQIGSKSPDVNYNRIFDDLRAFYEVFRTPILNCEVNNFLRLNNPKSRANRLMEDRKSSKLPTITNLSKLRDSGINITCKECSKIGDAVIVLEQPPSWSLVHLDNSFNEMCRVLGRDHKQIKSVPQVNKEAAMVREQGQISTE